MSSSKNSLLRYKTIDNCLRNRNRKWTLQDLMKACEQALYEYGMSGIGMASRRTIQMDLQFMRSEAGYSAPIIVVERKYYTYEDPEYSITKAPISKDDVRQLSEAVGLLKQMTGFSTMEGMEDIVSRLEDHVASMRTHQKPVIYFERNDRLAGLQFIPTIHQAILDKKVLKICYKSFRAFEPHTYFFSPYILKEFRNRWFLFGRHSKAKMLVAFALDRMLSVEVSETEKFHADPSFDPELYFENIVGVTKSDTPIQLVRFWASADEAPYIQTKPIHKSQELVQQNEDGSAVFQVRVIVNNELIRDLMGYAEGVCVLSPRSLVRIIQKKYVLGLNRYQKSAGE